MKKEKRDVHIHFVVTKTEAKKLAKNIAASGFNDKSEYFRDYIRHGKISK